MKNIFYSLTFILLVTTITKSNAQTSTAWIRANTLQKGVNMNNWLEAEWDIPLNWYPDTTFYTKKHFFFMKKAGFTTVRLPMIFETLADTFPPYNLHASHIAYSLLDSAINWAQGLGLNVIIDNHPSNDSSTYVLSDENYLTQIPRLCGVWKHLTQRYKSLDPNTTFFEIRNEPTDTISTANWRVAAQAIIDTIRNYDTQHTIIVGAASWNSVESLDSLVPFADTNIIYCFHFYEPQAFTDQGLPWNPQWPAGSRIFPLAGDVDFMRQKLIDAKNWSVTKNLPIWLGETGCSMYGDSVSRCNWISTMGFFLDSLNIPWLYHHAFLQGENPYAFMGVDSLFGVSTTITDSVISCFAAALHLNTTISSANEISTLYPSINIYPNPANQTITLVFDNSKQDNCTLTLCDSQGRLVRTIAGITTDKITIETKNLTSGFYFLHLQTDKKFIATGKLTIE